MRAHTAVGAAVVVTLAAAAILAAGAAVGRRSGPADVSADASAAVARPADPVARAQERLRLVPGDWHTWAALSVAYLERGRVTADPTYYPKADEAVHRSLALRGTGNAEALLANGALANARHDFAAARRHALAAVRINPYGADAFAVLADAETQLGNATAATAAIQRMLDLRPGLSAYTRASYDLELRGDVAAATDLMRQAVATAIAPEDIAFCRAQLGDLAWSQGDLDEAQRQYSAGLAADPSSVPLRRGQAHLAAAQGRLEVALRDYADLTARAPTPAYFLEYAQLLRAAGRPDDAAAQLDLAEAAHRLFTANGGVDGLTATALAIEAGSADEAVRTARAEWSLRRHPDVADALGWALHSAGRDTEALRYARLANARGARTASYAYHLGMIELALGRRSAARAHLARALEWNPFFSPTEAPLARVAVAGLGGVS